LDEVVSSTLVGGPDFISFVKDKILSDRIPDKELPALKALVRKVTVEDISDGVEVEFGEKPALARNVKMFLCQRYTGQKLKDIGFHFGIGESGVSQASRRMADKLKKDKKLKKTIAKIKNNSTCQE
jgi:chromosomal replication initiation ATPase DnaA